MRSISDIKTVAALLTQAEREAHALGDETPGAEHLLVAAASLDDSLASRGFTPEAVRAAIRDIHREALGADIPVDAVDHRPPRTYESSPSLKGALTTASKLTTDTPLQARHIVAAVGAQGHTIAAHVLRTLNIDATEVL